MKRPVKLSLMVLFGLLLGLLLAEFGMRWMDPYGISYHDQNRRFFDPENGAVIKGDDGLMRLRPNLELDVGFPIRTNSHGHRDDEFPRDKPEGEYRILMLGDSVVFGWGVPENVTFPRLVEQRLDQEAGDSLRVRLINAGTPGWNVLDEARYLRDQALDFDPDLVVVVFIPDDVPREVTPADKAARDEKLGRWGRFMFSDTLEELYLKQFVKHLYWLGLQREGVLEETVGVRNFDKDKEAREAYHMVLGEMVKMVRARGSDFILVDCLGRDYARDIAESLNIPYVTVLPGVEVTPQEYRISAVDGHGNEACHLMMSEKIYSGLIEHMPWPREGDGH